MRILWSQEVHCCTAIVRWQKPETVALTHVWSLLSGLPIQRKYLQVRNDHSSSPSSFPQGTCPEAIFVFYRGYETMMASIDEKTENEEK